MAFSTIKQKLTSRKFWLSIASAIGFTLTAFGCESEKVEITAMIGTIASVVIYVLTEGWVDGKRLTITTEPETVDEATVEQETTESEE